MKSHLGTANRYSRIRDNIYYHGHIYESNNLFFQGNKNEKNMYRKNLQLNHINIKH